MPERLTRPITALCRRTRASMETTAEPDILTVTVNPVPA